MEFRVALLITFLTLHYPPVRVQASPCDVGCVCISGIRSVCGNVSTTLDWSRLLHVDSTLALRVEPGSFLYGGYITHLDLSNNPSIILTNGSFQGLNNLLSLDLSENDLTSLPDGIFSPLINVVHVDLQHNDLASIGHSTFNKLDNLQTLDLTFNQLANFPPLDSILPSLVSVSLYANPIDCSSDNITTLLQLVRSGFIADVNSLRCSNGTLVRDLEYDLPTTSVSIATSTPYMTTPTSTLFVSITPTTASSQSSQFTISITSRDTPYLTSSVTEPTPRAVEFCPLETTLTSSGYLDWPQSPSSVDVMLECPNDGSVAFRTCMSSGVWGHVNDTLCKQGSPGIQILAAITQTSISAQTSEGVALQLTSLSSELFSVRELDTVSSVVEELVAVAGGNVLVLNYTLQFLDTLVQSNTDSISASPAITERLRTLIDSILLEALDANQTSLVLSFSHLAVGGAYLPPSNHSHLLVAIRLNANDSVAIEIGGMSDDANVTVEVDGVEGDVQVTVYENDNLFNQSNCSNASGESVTGGDVLTPVISVVNETPPSSESDSITITYGRITMTEGHSLVCVRWNKISCGGGVWTMSGCALVTSSTGQLQCRCVHQGTYAILDVPHEEGPTGEGQLAFTSRALFYTLTSLSLPLYLTIIITIAVSRHIRLLPTAQCLLFLALTQGLSFLVMMISHELTDVQWLCYSLGVVFHYTVLVSLSWMLVYPVLVAIKVFKIMWYERAWLLVPFGAVAWLWPVIPVAVYAGIKHSDFGTQPLLCWLEAATFPNTFTYIVGITSIAVIVTTFVTLILLACSDYTLESSIYLQIVSLLVNSVLFMAVVVTQFFAAASNQFATNQSYLLLATGGLSFACGLYFFITNGLAKSRLRSALACRTDPVIKNKLAALTLEPGDSGFNSQDSTRDKVRRSPVRLTDEMNINYVDDYLGYPHTSPVPLAMIGRVQAGNGLVRGEFPRNISEVSGPMFNNPLYGMSFKSDV